MEAHGPSSDIGSVPSSSTANLGTSEADLEEIARRVRETQEESERLDALQRQVAEQMGAAGVDGMGAHPQDVDSRSVFVGNVDYAAVPTELENHFKTCGPINRVTILCDRFSGTPKGYAYVEFADSASVERALGLNEVAFRGRPLKVTVKRTNVPGLGRGRGGGGGYGPGMGGMPGGSPYGGAPYGGGGYPMRGRGFAPRRFNPYFRPRGRRPYGP